MTLAKGTDVGAALAKSGLTLRRSTQQSSKLRGGRTADTQASEDRYDALKQYARDLTAAAREGKLDPVIGRDEEIRRTIQVLARRTKNNPVLIGEPGVGKTAIAEGLALRIANGDVPDGIKDRRLLSARHGLDDRRREISRRVRGAAQGRARRGQAGRGRDHPVHRRNAHFGRGREKRGRDGRVQPAQARTVPRRASLHRRDHARRISQACRKGCRARTTLPAGLHRRADGPGHHFDPSRAQGEIRAPPRRHGSPTRRSSPRRCCPTATFPTASCPTRRST